MSSPTLSFKSAEGEAQYLDQYAANMTLWPVPFEELRIPTSHGTTHLIACGPLNAPPLILLHAYGFSATSWYANVATLAKDHRVYAVDVMGDMNQTVQTKHFKKRAETAVWLKELLDALGLGKVSMIGHSYGGWLTLNFALCAPERLNRMVLLAPAASFVPMVGSFNLRRILAYFFPNRGLDHFARWCLAPGNTIPQGMTNLMRLAMKHYRFTGMVVQPNVYTDEELRSIETPALLLIGEQEVIYQAGAAMERATRLLKRLQTQVIPGAAHILIMEQPEPINQAIGAFLDADD